MNLKTNAGAMLLFVVVLCIIVVWPLLLIWAVNILFSMGIEYTLLNWFASSVIIYCLNGTVKRK